MKILASILTVVFATGVFAGGNAPPVGLDPTEPSKIYVGAGFSDFNTYQVSKFSIENDIYNEHSQGITVLVGYHFIEYGDWTLGGEIRVGQSNWNLPLDTFDSNLLAKATYHLGYVGLYVLGGISYQEYKNWNLENTGPAFGLGIVGAVTDNASVFLDYVGKPMDLWHDYSEDYIDSGAATVGITYSF